MLQHVELNLKIIQPGMENKALHREKLAGTMCDITYFNPDMSTGEKCIYLKWIKIPLCSHKGPFNNRNLTKVSSFQ